METKVYVGLYPLVDDPAMAQIIAAVDPILIDWELARDPKWGTVYVAAAAAEAFSRIARALTYLGISPERVQWFQDGPYEDEDSRNIHYNTACIFDPPPWLKEDLERAEVV